MTEDLRVDTALVRQSGGKLQAIAGLIPEPPATFTPEGTDPLSTAIAGRVAEVVDPVIAQMPITRDELTRYAQNVLAAADQYDAADHRIAEEILKRLGLFDEAGAGGGGMAAAPSSTTAPTAPTAPPGGQDQMGQLMQMAQQAAQIPMQLASMAAAIPQAMMQGVHSAVQQASQMSQMSGEDAAKLGDEELELPEEADEELELPEEADEERPAGQAERRPDGAAPGNSGGERVPDPAPQEAEPERPAGPKPAPTRPAGSGPEIAL